MNKTKNIFSETGIQPALFVGTASVKKQKPCRLLISPTRLAKKDSSFLQVDVFKYYFIR